MSQKIYWNHARDFSEEEWGVILRHARRVVGESRQAHEGLVVDTTPEKVSLNGPALARGETFVLTRQAGGDRVCETGGHPYTRHIVNILGFAAKIAPDALACTREHSPLETYRNDRRKAFESACYDFSLHPESSVEELATRYAQQFGCDVGTVTLPAVEEARRRVVDERFAPYLFANGPATLRATLRYVSDDGTTSYGGASLHEDFEIRSVEQVGEALRTYEAGHLSQIEHETLDVDAFGEVVTLPGDGPVLARVTGYKGIEVTDRDFLLAWRNQVDREKPMNRDAWIQTGDDARGQCSLEAESALLDDPTADLNGLVEAVRGTVNAGRRSARLGVEDAYRHLDHASILEEIHVLRDNLAATQHGCRGMGSRLGSGVRTDLDMKLEYHFGTLLARAMGEWDVALISAERSLTNEEDFFKLALIADQVMHEAGEVPPEEWERPEDSYPCRMYQREQNRRSHAYQLVGEYVRWKEAAREFTGILADLGERRRGRIQDGAILGRLDIFLRGNGRSPWDGSSAASVVDAVGRMAALSEIICQFNVGGERAVSRDYLNMLEIAADLELHSPEEIIQSGTFQSLNREARGTEKTAAEMLEDIRDELTGSEMLGEATSQEVGGFTQFQTEETPETPQRKGARR